MKFYMDPKIGYQIKNFDKLRPIGKGGFATVYEAKQKGQEDIEVAIKEISRASISSNQKKRELVQQEVSIHKKLQHDAIVKLYNFFEDDKNVYLVLELCKRGSLDEYLQMNGPLTENKTCQLMKPVVQAVAYLHKNNVIHRDLKLKNLLLTEDMKVKIADFGMATELSQPNETKHTMLGTANFMPPEVATRSSHSFEADYWSLGCVLYTLLVGKPPFDGKDPKKTLQNVISAECKIPDHLSSDAKSLIKALLTKDPKQRIKISRILRHPFFNPPRNLEAPTIGNNYHQTRASSDLGTSVSNTLSSKSQSIGFVNRCPQALMAIQEISMSDSGCSCNPEHTRKHFGSMTNHRHLKQKPPNRFVDSITLERINSFQETVCSERNRAPCSHISQCSDVKIDKGLGVPPLNTCRLKPRRELAKYTMYSILESGELVLEYLRVKGEMRYVQGVYKISKDGLWIGLYKIRPCRPLADKPVLPPRADTIHHYDSLPSMHWKIYRQAYRFLDLVRSKTPKITFYGDQARCIMMDNGPDPNYLLEFYANGAILTKRKNEVTIEYDGHASRFQNVEDFELSPKELDMWNEFTEMRITCEFYEKQLEIAASEVPSKYQGSDCFPFTIGMRRDGCSFSNNGSKGNILSSVMQSSAQMFPNSRNFSRGSASWSNRQGSSERTSKEEKRYPNRCGQYAYS